jgi:hypothetical protein
MADSLAMSLAPFAAGRPRRLAPAAQRGDDEGEAREKRRKETHNETSHLLKTQDHAVIPYRTAGR